MPTRTTATDPPARAHLTRRQAELLTERIRGHVEQTWVLLEEAYERQAHTALGYATWADYTQAEFGIDRGHSYRLIDQAIVVRELAAAAGVTGDEASFAAEAGITQRAAADLRDNVGRVAQKVAKAVKGVRRERRPEVVRGVIERERRRPEGQEISALQMSRARDTGIQRHNDLTGSSPLDGQTLALSAPAPGTSLERVAAEQLLFMAKLDPVEVARLIARNPRAMPRVTDWVGSFSRALRRLARDTSTVTSRAKSGA